ncbi:STAS domain-containing protein [Mycolicibacterium chubuense]|uniref:STAS domain-containing protein n=1 Tax=Mycolicibacterium chubuense TaxID=1800 RepID=UPI0005A1FBD5|nr:STAS domain-containing protein [Mycolicibacterium chubuense]
MGLLDVEQDIADGAVVVCVRGEVDSGTVQSLTAALDGAFTAAVDAPSRVLIVDLGGVTYFGSAGLNAVVGCFERGVADGVEVRVVADNAEVLRPIEVTKLDSVLRPFKSIVDALAPRDAR